MLAHRLATLALVALALLASGCTSRTAPIDYYWFDADGQLMVQVETGGDFSTTKAIGVDETEDAVTITVWTETAPLPMAGVGVPVNLSITLPTPLGGRELVDGSRGTPIDLCQDIEWCTSRGGGSGAGS
jgi:hypothetical protein